MGAADIRGAAEYGSGVLAQLTLRAKAAGVSLISIPQIDIDDDGNVDMGPRLTSSNSGFIGDINGDDFFDGPITAGAVAVDQNCSAVEVPEPAPPVTEPPSSSPGADTETLSESSPGEDTALTGSQPSSDPSQAAGEELVAIPAEITDSSPIQTIEVAPPDEEAEDTPSDEAADDPSEADDASSPRQQGASSSSDSSFPWWIVVPAALGALGVSLLAVWWLRGARQWPM